MTVSKTYNTQKTVKIKVLKVETKNENGEVISKAIYQSDKYYTCFAAASSRSGEKEIHYHEAIILDDLSTPHITCQKASFGGSIKAT